MAMSVILAAAQQLRTANESVTQIGVGGIFALLVIREVFSFIKNKKNGGPVSHIEYDENQRAVTCHEFEHHKSMAQYKDNCQEIVKRFDNTLNNLVDYNAQRRDFLKDEFKKIDQQFAEVKHLINSRNKL